jgi:TIR domain
MTWQIFISYSSRDNQPFGPHQTRYVSRLYDDLKVAVGTKSGSDASIWFDRDMSGGTDFPDEISRGLVNSLVLVPLLSPSYLRDGSGWLATERESFKNAAREGPSPKIQYKYRIFPVLLHQIEDAVDTFGGTIPLPSEFGTKNIAHRFCDDRGVPLPLGSNEYDRLVHSLAFDLNKRINELNKLSQAPAVAKNLAKHVYLASSSPDTYAREEQLREELQRQGDCIVLPTSPSRRLRPEGVILEDLAKCSLSVHLVGGELEESPEDLSRAVREFNLANKHSKRSNLVQVAWMSPNTDVSKLTASTNETVSDFIAQLPKLGQTYNREIFPRLLCFLNRTLKEIQEFPPPPEPFLEGELSPFVLPKVYWLCPPEDQPALADLENQFRLMNWCVEFPAKDPESDDGKKWHEENLRDCQSIVIYFGSRNETWVNLARKSFWNANNSLFKRMPIYSRWIYRGPQENDEKVRYPAKDKFEVEGDFSLPTGDFIQKVINTRQSSSRTA